MISAIRNVESSLGDGKKRVMQSEQKNREIIRKSIVASKKILKGEVLSENNITTKRPGFGLSPMLWDEIIGKKASKTFNIDEFIEL